MKNVTAKSSPPDLPPNGGGRDLFKIAHIIAAHGIRGEVKLRCFLENPDDIVRYAPLTDKNGRTYTPTISGHQKELLIMRFAGVTDRNQAELLRGIELYADKNTLPAKKENEFFAGELMGLQVILENGDAFGKVLAVHNFGAGDVLEIAKTDGNSEFFAFNKKTFPKYDKKKGNITLNIPEEI